jgi:hypothetical protein
MPKKKTEDLKPGDRIIVKELLNTIMIVTTAPIRLIHKGIHIGWRVFTNHAILKTDTDTEHEIDK